MIGIHIPQEAVRIPQRDPGEQHVHQAALELPFLKLLVAAEEHAGIGSDIGFEQIGRVKLRENLNHFRLRGGVIGKLAHQPDPRLHRRCGYRRAGRQSLYAAAERRWYWFPAGSRTTYHRSPAVVLTRDLGRPAQPRFESRHAVPGLGEGWSKLAHRTSESVGQFEVGSALCGRHFVKCWQKTVLLPADRYVFYIHSFSLRKSTRRCVQIQPRRRLPTSTRASPAIPGRIHEAALLSSVT